MAQMLELADKNIKNSYYNCSPYVQKLRRDIDDIFIFLFFSSNSNGWYFLKTQIMLLKMKNIMTKIKKVDEINGKLDIAEGKISELEDSDIYYPK